MPLAACSVGRQDSGCPASLRGVSARHFPGEQWSSMSAARFLLAYLRRRLQATGLSPPLDRGNLRSLDSWDATQRCPRLASRLCPSLVTPSYRCGLEFSALAISLSSCRRSRLCRRPPRFRIKGGSAVQDKVSPNPSADKQVDTRFRVHAVPLGGKNCGIRPVPIFPSRSAALSEEWRAIWFPFCL